MSKEYSVYQGKEYLIGKGKVLGLEKPDVLLRREKIREENRRHFQQPLRPMLRMIRADIEGDMQLLQQGDVEKVMQHLAYYVARLSVF